MDGAITKLVIFDCDGVLVDSEPIALDVLVSALAEKGVAIARESASERFLGRSLSHLARSIETDFGVSIDTEFLNRMREALYQRFRTDLKPLPGIEELLLRLRRNDIGWCVASSSQVERVRLSLSLTGLLPSFEPHIFSATMVDNGKPAPDLFLFAAAAMGYEPRDCVVIEDSPSGVRAAQAAGMRVCAFTGGSHTADPSYRSAMATLMPDLTTANMNQIAAFICPEQPI